MMPLMLAMGARWLIVQALNASGEPAATRAFALTEGGLRDELVLKGLLGRTEVTAWTWAPFSRASPMGAQPACLALDAEGRLLMLAHNAAKALVVAVTMLPVEAGGEGGGERLTLQVAVADGAGNELLRIKRVFTRSRAAA
jgi:hypothetical protein